jgi:hypothetical protein
MGKGATNWAIATHWLVKAVKPEASPQLHLGTWAVSREIQVKYGRETRIEESSLSTSVGIQKFGQTAIVESRARSTVTKLSQRRLALYKRLQLRPLKCPLGKCAVGGVRRESSMQLQLSPGWKIQNNLQLSLRVGRFCGIALIIFGSGLHTALQALVQTLRHSCGLPSRTHIAN